MLSASLIHEEDERHYRFGAAAPLRRGSGAAEPEPRGLVPAPARGFCGRIRPAQAAPLLKSAAHDPDVRLTLYGCLAACLLAPCALAAPKAPDEPSAAISREAENTVVKVFSTIRRPDVARPWSKASPLEATGSGVVIEGKRILTNAHVVLYASQVQVQANQAGDKISASVEAIAPGIDLAVLKLDDESFFDTHPPLPRAEHAAADQGPRARLRLPDRRHILSITKGIVSRIEFVPYNFPSPDFASRSTRPINPGNSGGPAIADDKMIGLAFSHLGEAREHRLHHSQRGDRAVPQGHCRRPLRRQAGDATTTCRRWRIPALRGFLKLDNSVAGMIVHRPDEQRPRLPAQGVGRDHADRRSRRSTTRAWSGSVTTARELPLPDPEGGAVTARVPLTIVRAGQNRADPDAGAAATGRC